MTISTFYSPRLTTPAAARTFPTDSIAAFAEAAHWDRVADLHLSEGRGAQADRLSHLALELRCRALGARA